MYRDSKGASWLRGGLHIHTKQSDGKLAPKKVMDLYCNAGYDFISLTDHWVFNYESNYRGMAVLGGAEYDVGRETGGGIYHILSIGSKYQPALIREIVNQPTAKERAQFVIDAINKAEGAAVLAHPLWSLNRPEDIMTLKNLSMVEIFNAVSGHPWGNRADSSPILDLMAVSGFTLPVAATDDTHYYEGEECSSFVYVKSEDTDRQNILKAVKEGNVYASRGPTLDIERAGNELIIKTSPVYKVMIQTGIVWIPDRVKISNNKPITEVVYKIRENDLFVRVEVWDADGKQAWSGYYIP